MALTVFFALGILGIDFMLYVLFQWTWGDKRRAIARQVASYRKQFDAQARLPFLVPSEETPPASRRSAGTRAEAVVPRHSPNTRIA
jgi:hypothetical protein